MTSLLEHIDKGKLFEQLAYKPMEHQQGYHKAEQRFRIAVCGRRAGKTSMAGNDRIGNLLVPGTLGWIVGPTYDLGMKEFRVMWDSLIVNGKLGHDKRVKRNFSVKSGDMYIEMPWGARVEVRSANHPETLVGDGLHWVIMSEAAKQNEETWQKYIRPALADHRGTADFVTTPEGKNWIYDLYNLGRSRPELYKSFRFPSWVNTEVFPGGEQDEEILHLKETTVEEWFLQEIAAEFTAVVGRIFSEFDEETHVLPTPHVFNPAWKNYIAFDWGFTAPLAAIEFQVSPRDEVYVWREHYVTNRTLEWHLAELKARPNPPGYHLDGAFGDAADPEAVEVVSRELVYCQADPDSKMWLPGIRLMKEALKPREIGKDEYDRPIMGSRYHVDPSCTNHINEMTGYRAKKGISSNEFKGSGVVERNIADHCLAAGTLVTTENGDVPIENVQVGQLVATRKGWKAVTDAWQTSPSTEVMKLTCDDGTELVGTPNHRIWVEDQGWVRLDALRYGDILTSKHCAAPVRVVNVTALPEKQAVYDLTVEDAHEFYANGVLVHNSIDAVRYALMHLWKVGVQHHLDEVYAVTNHGTPRETITVAEPVGSPSSFFNFNLDAGGGRF